MSQFDSYNEQPKSDLKEALKYIANSDMTENQVRLIISQLSQQQCPQNNSQFGDH
jgi:hypothetical protein